MFRIFCTLALFSIAPFCRSGELTTKQLIAGVNQARNQIKTGEMRLLITFDYEAKKSPEEIQVWIQEQREEILREYPSPHQKDLRQGSLNDLPLEAKWYDKRQEREESNIAFKIFDADPVHNPRLFQYKMNQICRLETDLFSEEAAHVDADAYRVITYDGKTQAYEALDDFPADSISFVNRSLYRSFLYFHQYGRSTYRLPPNAKLADREVIAGVNCYVLEFQPSASDPALPPGRLVKIWVDPEKAFCVLKQESQKLSDDKRPPDTWTMIYEDFRQYGNIWFPTVSRWIHKWPGGKLDRVNTFVVKEAQFNLDFPIDFFNVDRKSYLNQSPHLQLDPQGLEGLLGKSPLDLKALLDKSQTPPSEQDRLLLSCGPYSLLRICQLLGVESDFNELAQLSRFDPDEGTTLLGLRDAAKYKGLNPKGIQANLKLLKKDKVPMPAIAYVKGNHFLVFEETVSDGVLITDPADKYDHHLIFNELAPIWNGVLLTFDYQPEKAQPISGPLAVAEPKLYDFGEALGGSKIWYTFKLKNVGNQPLKIVNVEQSCACTATIVSNDEIPPGALGSIEAVLSVPSENTSVEESINVYTNDSVQGRIALTLKGTAFVPITTFPTHLRIGTVQSKTSITRSLSIHQKGKTTVLGVRTDAEYLKAILAPAKVDSVARVELTLLESAPVGQFNHNLLIDYRYEGKETTHNVPVFGDILGEFTVSPKHLFFGLVKGTVTKTAQISSVYNHPFNITSVQPNSAYLTAAVNRQPDQVGYQLKATVLPQAPAGELSGEILMKTNSAIQPTIRVTFSGIISTESEVALKQ